MYYIYILRCNNDSLYTGITIDLQRRIKEHFGRSKKCAKYTFSNQVKKLEIAWQAENRAMACKLEYHLKQLSKKDKEDIIQTEKLELLNSKIECNRYKML